MIELGGQNQRNEFGFPRTSCSCWECKLYCKSMPGYLIPSDLERLIPADADPLVWAESHLRASPGATVMVRGQLYKIPTLVPLGDHTGRCHWLGSDDSCTIWEKAPFGCSFFDACDSDANRARGRNQLPSYGLWKILEADAKAQQSGGKSLYQSIWDHLHGKGLVADPPEIRRARIQERKQAREEILDRGEAL
jgi:hypothetical protein